MKFTQLSVLLPAGLLLAACQGAPPPVSLAPPAPSVGGARGIDMATDSSDVAGQLRGVPINFVARYYRDPTSRWPALTPAEAARLSAMGLKIVTVWEWHSSDSAYFTYATGYRDAVSASQQARTIGQPPGSAIYFAVDFNARDSALWSVDQYFRGVNIGLAAAGGGAPQYRVGVYGSGAVCTAIKGAGLAQYAWLTGSTAWDGTAGYAAWNIKQAPHGGRFPNLAFDHDANDARDDYGGFQLANYAGPSSPAAAAVAVAAAVPAAAASVVNSAVTSVVQPLATPAPPPLAPTPVATPALPSATPAAPASSPPAYAATAAPAPKASTSAAEVAALAAAEPPVPPAPPPQNASQPSTASRVGTAALEAAALAAATVLPRRAEAAEEPHASTRSLERAEARDEPSRERTGAHAGKALAGSGRKAYAIATNNRAVATPLRNPGGVSHGEVHEPGHRVSASRRSEDHGAHVQAGHGSADRVPDRSARRSVEQRGSERPHRPRGVSG